MADLNIYSRPRDNCSLRDNLRNPEAINIFLWNGPKSTYTGFARIIIRYLRSRTTDDRIDIGLVNTDIAAKVLQK